MRAAAMALLLLAACSSHTPTPMDAHVLYLSPDELAAGAARAGVVELAAGADARARYAALGDQAVLPPGVALVALVRTPVLTTEDRVEVVEAEDTGDGVRVVVEITTYTGALFASVARVALVEVVLGERPPGTYTLTVVARVVPFEDLANPSRTGTPVDETNGYPFTVQATAR